MCTRQRPAMAGTRPAVGSLGLGVPRRALLVVLLATLAAARPASSQVFEALGERALGMGGAFVAVADDATATYWNPAGLALGASVDACLSRASGEALAPAASGPAAARTSATSFCLAFPAFGFSYSHLRGSNGRGAISPTAAVAGGRQDLRLRGVGVSSLATRQAGVTFVQSLLPGLAVGTTVKYVRAVAAAGEAPAGATPPALLEAASSAAGRGSSTIDLDLGVMATAGPIRAGVTVRNARAPGFETAGGETLRLQRQVRVGLALTPGSEALLHASGDTLILALDVDLTRTATSLGDRRMVAAGVERWLAGHRVGVRAGGRANTVGSARPAATAGVSVGVKRGLFLEAHAARGHDAADRGWGIGMRAGF